MVLAVVHYDDVIMNTIASQITSLMIVYSTFYSDADQSKHQSSASLAFVWGIHRDRWIPRTKGQLRGKCFHLMTSSWYSQTLFYIFWLLFPGAKWPPFRRRCFRMLFHELKVFYLIDISLKFVPKGPIGKTPVLVQIMAWCRIGDKSLSELNLSRFAEACGTKWRWIKTFLRQMSHHGVSTRRSFSKYMQICHYNEITWALRRLESLAVQLLFNPIFRLTTRVRSFVRRIRR